MIPLSVVSPAKGRDGLCWSLFGCRRRSASDSYGLPEIDRLKVGPILALLFLSFPSWTFAGPQKACTASSEYSASLHPAAFALDGRPDTRWASWIFSGQPEWIQVDLGQVIEIRGLEILWETACAVEYQIRVSEEGASWKNVYETDQGRPGKATFNGLSWRGRYLRIWCEKPSAFAVFSIWEITSSDPDTQTFLTGAFRKDQEAREMAGRQARDEAVRTLIERGEPQVVFAVRKPGTDGHWYTNFGYYSTDENLKCYQTGGSRLCRLDLATGQVTDILEAPEGLIRDPQIHYDGQRILFSYLKPGTTRFHLYEIQTDGSGLKQLTDGDFDDIEPTYLPEGGILFCSGRCFRWVNCWVTQVATLYRCQEDGSDVRMVSANIEQDNTPWVLPDGRILYTRWEYVDRSQVDYHHLWTSRPDGTNQRVFFGNLHPGIVMIDAKPIPDSPKVVAIFSPWHGQLEHMGEVTVVDPREGPDRRENARCIPAGMDFRDPFPLNEEHFLVAKGPSVGILDLQGNFGSLFELATSETTQGLWCHEPRPLSGRNREPVLPDRTQPTEAPGRLLLSDAYHGRNMAGVEPGEIKKLLVLESLPKPINYTGGMDPLSWGGTFTLERVVGTVPVEPDGSAYFELPSGRSFFFVALDENNISVKRMQSFLSVQPGEVLGCTGCHEQRAEAVPHRRIGRAFSRPPSPVIPQTGLPDVFDFPRDIQPILDRHCLRCHDTEPHGEGAGPFSGGVLLSKDRGPMFSLSYAFLTVFRQFVDGRNDPKSNLPPRSIGSSASPLMTKIQQGHHGVQASPEEVDTIRLWIETGAPYPGTYAALGCGSIGGYYGNALIEMDKEWPESQKAGEAFNRRCVSCHTGSRRLPLTLCDEREISFWRPDWNDRALRLSRHLVFNLSRPDQSLMLRAPLSKEAGGLGLCRDAQEPGTDITVFRDTTDPDYQLILSMCEAGHRRLEEIKRFDMPGFRPPTPYLREMARYGILDKIPPEKGTVDCYALDQRYWRSLWPVSQR